MDKLISFISRYHAFFIFLILEFVCFGFIFRKNDFQRSVFIGSTNAITGNVYSGINNVADYFNLAEINDSLGGENARLKALLKSYEVLDSGRFSPIFDTMTNKLMYRACYAKVINYTINREDNFILLNKGMRNGVRKGIGIVTDQGIVGIIKEVSYDYAAAYSILSTYDKKGIKRAIGAKLKNTNHLGSISWPRGDHRYVELNDISNYVTLNIGDTIVSSGNSEIFPSGETVGYIEEYGENERTGFYDIKVKLAADMSELEYVYVIDNRQVKELRDLKLEDAE